MTRVFLHPLVLINITFPEFNLGPLFLLDGLVDKLFNLKRREYIYKRKESGALATHFKHLADPDEGSSVKTYRKQQCDRAHLPLKLWKTM